MSDHPEDVALITLCWVLPLAGLVFGPGETWEYIVWLVIGTTVLFLYEHLVLSRREQ
jgi:hypothetical protein